MSEVARLDLRTFDDRYPELFAELSRLCSALGASADSDDIAQEALIDGRAHLHQLQDDAKLLPWLRRIAARRVGRSRRREQSMWTDQAALDRVSSGAASVELSIDEAAALARLPRRQRQLVALVYVVGYSQEDAADVLGISRGTVARTLWEARLALAKALEDHRPQGRAR